MIIFKFGYVCVFRLVNEKNNSKTLLIHNPDLALITKLTIYWRNYGLWTICVYL